MSKTPKADALRDMRERNFQKRVAENERRDRVETAKRALAKAEAKPRKAKRRKR